MTNDSIPYCKTGYFSKLMCDYLADTKELKPFYNKLPSKENLVQLASEKAQWFSQDKREVLVKELQNQNKFLSLSASSEENIKALANPETVTITTGHQLNLFTGSLYFFYKILDVINASMELNEFQNEHRFVPVF